MEKRMLEKRVINADSHSDPLLAKNLKHSGFNEPHVEKDSMWRGCKFY